MKEKINHSISFGYQIAEPSMEMAQTIFCHFFSTDVSAIFQKLFQKNIVKVRPFNIPKILQQSSEMTAEVILFRY